MENAEIKKLYRSGMDVKGLARKAGVSRSDIRGILTDMGVKLVELVMTPKIQKKLDNYDWLYKQYITQAKSPQTIANELQIKRTSVSVAIKKHKIPKRGKLEARQIRISDD